ncbi:MAG: methyltransferase domain-containing protein [Saprospiraceae bacterium]|nr:methyltransferase domain-containing protein [Saprospiraceae bacterium]
MNTNTNTIVDWKAYAQKYDMLLAYNPFYQETHQEVINKISDWNMAEGDLIADVGAGTGNYSVEVARLFPQARILHIDNDEGMIARASEKAAELKNFQILDKPIGEVQFAEESLQGLLCINAIYTFPNPKAELKKMYRWLAPGAQIVLVDAGRIMNLRAWTLALAWSMLRKHGLRTTLKVLKEAKAVSQQNAYIRENQQNGTFWTHSHEQFCEAVLEAGFLIENASVCFRGDCDLVIARKP